jgi:hypothetical protein
MSMALQLNIGQPQGKPGRYLDALMTDEGMIGWGAAAWRPDPSRDRGRAGRR